MESKLRTETITLRFSKAELRALDALKDKKQLTVPYEKVSRTDIIIQAINFASDKIFNL